MSPNAVGWKPVWAEVHNGEITNGSVNVVPR
jgi:hypothetical protein